MYITVQYLRGVAALSVVLFHVLAYYLPSKGYYSFVFASGVDFFFVISGFIMVVTTRKGFAPAAFAWARFWRIVPYWWVMLFAYIAVRTLLGSPWPQTDQIVQSALLIPHFNEGSGEPVPILGPGWSLTSELVFYFLFGLTLAASVGRPARHLGLLFAAFSALVAMRLLAEPESAIGVRLTSPMFLEFLLGCAVAYYLEPIAGFVRRFRMTFLLGGLVMLGVVNGVIYREGLPRVAVFGFPYMLILAGALLYEPEAKRAEFGFMRKLGDASYSLYLTHMLVLVVLDHAGFFSALPGPAAVPLAIAMTVAVGLFAYAWIEKPLLEAGRPRRRLVPGQRKPQSAT